MKADLTSGIVRFPRPDKETAGTGFMVADDLALTCAHVIPAAAQPGEGKAGADVELLFRAGSRRALAAVVPEWFRPAEAEDVAFLRLKEPLPQGARPFSLGSSQGASGHLFQTFGFPSASPEEGIRGDGRILGETLMQGIRVLQLSSPQITPGFSGAPVFDTATSRVVGMVNAIAPQDGYGRLAETAFMIPAETLRQICPLLTLSDVQPYLGLSAFKESDAEFFFGRKREVERLLDALRREPRFLAVLGPSGSGKSSVAQAGLIPELRKGGLPGSDRWGFIIARPGERPLQNLEAAGLAGGEGGLALAVRGWLKKNPGNTRIMLILDQFEEIFAGALPADTAEFLRQLQSLLDSDLPLTLMLIMRDDFFSRLGREAQPALFQWVQRGFVHISAALEEREIAEIIEGPAEKVGLQLEEGLVDAMVRDVLLAGGGERAGRSTALPLLEFALTQMWIRRREGYLTHEAYSNIGGVTGSLTQWADQAYQGLAQEGLGDVARRVLTELVSLGDERQGIPDSKRRRSMGNFGTDSAEREAARTVIKRLADARLVATSFDPHSENETVEIIHDTLIREWGRLRGWLKEDRSFLSWKREMEKRAAAWEEGGRDEGRLLRGLDLTESESWREKRRTDLGEAEERLIAASLALRERESREKELRRRRIILGLAGFSALALLLAAAAVWQWNLSEEKSAEALSLYLASQSMQIDPASESDWMRKTLLAVESLRQKETAQGDLALRESISLLGVPLAQLDHNGSVYSVAFSPDGKLLATECNKWPDFKVCFWDLQSGQKVHELSYNGSVSSVAFSPDGKLVATGSLDSTARIRDVKSGHEILKITHDDFVESVAFSPNGKLIATASGSTASVWDAKSGQKVHELPHNAGVYSVAFSPDGELVATASYDHTARIWDLQSGQKVHELAQGWAKSVAFSPDGKLVATAGGDFTARIWDVQSGQGGYRLPHDGPVSSVAFSPDGKLVATASGSSARIWDVQSGQEVHRLPHDGPMSSVAFSPDGKLIATAGYSSVRIWDVQSGQEVHKLPHGSEVFSVAFSPDGKLVATDSNDFKVRIWDSQNGQAVHELPHNGSAFSVAFRPPDGKFVAIAANSSADIWDAESGQMIHELPHNGWVYSVAFNLEGKLVATAGDENEAHIWDVQSGQEVHKLPHNGSVNCVAFSPDGKMVATASEDSTARIWDVRSGQKVHELPHDFDVYSVAFSPDGKLVVTASDDHTASIWDVKSGQKVHELPHNEPVYSVAFSPPDGKMVATRARYDSCVRIWDAESGQVLHELTHDSPVNSVAFSPDGNLVATASGDKTVRIWDVETGQELHKLPHDGSVYSVAFSPDGKLVATASKDNTAYIWPVSTGDLIREACSRVTSNLTEAEWNNVLRGSYCNTCPREGRSNKSFDLFTSIKLNLKRAQSMIRPSSTPEPAPGECQPCIAEAFANRK